MFFKRNPKEARASFFVYYGFGALDALGEYSQVVLQPDHYTQEDLLGLKAGGTKPLAYLSLGEHFPTRGEQAVWQRPARNDDWATHYVQVGHPLWQKHLRSRAAAYLAKGFEGLFLDTLETVDVFPEDRAPMLALLTSLRAVVGAKPLVANRGFSLLPELAPLVDAVLFEGFSTRWTAEGYEALAKGDLEWTRHTAERLRRAGLEVYALDYGATPELRAFAQQRANTFGLESLVSNRDLTEI